MKTKKSSRPISEGVIAAMVVGLIIVGWIAYILVFAILTGRPYYKLSSDRIRAVEKEMKHEFTDFSKLRFDASPPRLNMRVYIDGELDKERAVMFFSSLTGKLIIQDLKDAYAKKHKEENYHSLDIYIYPNNGDKYVWFTVRGSIKNDDSISSLYTAYEWQY